MFVDRVITSIKEKGGKLIVSIDNILNRRKHQQLYYREIFDQVVREILDGQLEHNQQVWHCDSAHCVCGWFEMRTIDDVLEQYVYKPGNPSFKYLVNDIYYSTNTLFRETGKYLDGPVMSIKHKIVAELTGYDAKLLDNMFLTSNKKEDIRRVAQQLGIIHLPLTNAPLETIKTNQSLPETQPVRLR